MTVKEAISLLKKMPDHEVKLMLDCPYCGKAKEIKGITKIVLISSKEGQSVERINEGH